MALVDLIPPAVQQMFGLSSPSSEVNVNDRASWMVTPQNQQTLEKMNPLAAEQVERNIAYEQEMEAAIQRAIFEVTNELGRIDFEAIAYVRQHVQAAVSNGINPDTASEEAQKSTVAKAESGELYANMMGGFTASGSLFIEVRDFFQNGQALGLTDMGDGALGELSPLPVEGVTTNRGVATAPIQSM